MRGVDAGWFLAMQVLEIPAGGNYKERRSVDEENDNKGRRGDGKRMRGEEEERGRGRLNEGRRGKGGRRGRKKGEGGGAVPGDASNENTVGRVSS